MKKNSDNTEKFDSSLGEVVNIIVSYDMGWSKRGNGKSYDSLNGYGAIIGFINGKVLDYATRNRMCRKCSKGHPPESHDCRKNFVGSAKSMEADVGAQLCNNSSILKEANLRVRVIVGNDDTGTHKAVNQGSTEHVFKLSDSNHLKKNFQKELYKLSASFKSQLKPYVIKHLMLCFRYAVQKNLKKPKKIAEALNCITDHSYGNHTNCGDWCRSVLLNNDQNDSEEENDENSLLIEEEKTQKNKNKKVHTVCLTNPQLITKTTTFRICFKCFKIFNISFKPS